MMPSSFKDKLISKAHNPFQKTLKSKQPVNLPSGSNIVTKFSRKSKNTVTKSADKVRSLLVKRSTVNVPGICVAVTRNMDALKTTKDVRGLPLFHPTVNTLNSDYSIVVSNSAGKEQGAIRVHRKHLCNNLQYFKAMFDENSNFRESSMDESGLVTPHSPQEVNEYFKAIYDNSFFLTTDNCLAFYHTADFYNDEVLLPSCIAFIKDNMQESMIFDLLQQTSTFDSACVEYVKSNGISDIAKHRRKIGRLPASQFRRFFKEISRSLKTIERLSLLSYWIEANQDCIEVVMDAEYYDLTAKERFNFLQFLKNKLKDSAFNVAYNHVIGATNISADRFLQYMGQNRLILSDITSLEGIDYTDMERLLRSFVDKDITFRIGRRIDDYLLTWKEQKLIWVPAQKCVFDNTKDGDFKLDQRSEGWVIRHAINTDFALTASIRGQPHDYNTVKLSQWLGNDNQKLHISPDLQGNEDGFVKLSFVQDLTKFIYGKFQPALFSSLMESDSMPEGDLEMINAQSWLKFYPV